MYLQTNVPQRYFRCIQHILAHWGKAERMVQRDGTGIVIDHIDFTPAIGYGSGNFEIANWPSARNLLMDPPGNKVHHFGAIGVLKKQSAEGANQKSTIGIVLKDIDSHHTYRGLVFESDRLQPVGLQPIDAFSRRKQ